MNCNNFLESIMSNTIRRNKHLRKQNSRVCHVYGYYNANYRIRCQNDWEYFSDSGTKPATTYKKFIQRLNNKKLRQEAKRLLKNPNLDDIVFIENGAMSMKWQVW